MKDLSLVEKITLDIIFNGTKKTNFLILEMLPTDIKNIMKKTGLSKVPVNVHVNKLEKFGLLHRARGTGKLYPTKLTRTLLKSVNNMSKLIEAGVDEILPKLIR